MRLFVELLRERVGSPLSLASMARDLAVAPATLKRYLDILEALFIVLSAPGTATSPALFCRALRCIFMIRDWFGVIKLSFWKMP